MPYALLKVTPEWFTEMLKSVKEGATRRYDVIKNALPSEEEHPCPTCDGEGMVDFGRCPDCGGDGTHLAYQ